MKSWIAPFSTQSHFAASPTLSTFNGGAAKDYMEIPQVKNAIAVHLTESPLPPIQGL